ncbi:MAG: Tex-like N-terminal domain-containing protein, partial [Spirochaetia bacterium]
MNQKHIATIASELGLESAHVAGAAALFAEGSGVPFIARYRKERTGEMAEDTLVLVRDRLTQLEELDTRRAAILDSLRERELLTPELAAALEAAQSRAALEDLYLPYRPKRKTRATAARERGLEPLARRILDSEDVAPSREAVDFVDVEAGVVDADAALAGARDIIAEWISEDAELRAELRELFAARAHITAKRAPRRGRKGGAGKGGGGTGAAAGAGGRGGASTGAAREDVYKDYFDWDEHAGRAPSHRVLAMFRGEHEGVLTVHVLPEEERALSPVRARYVRGRGERADEIEQAAVDAYRRLLAPSLETEAKGRLKAAADETAASVFASNLRELLLAPPLGERPVLAVDPGFRTGCKVVCLDAQGRLLHNEAIYPLEPQNRREEAARRVRHLLAEYGLEVIAVGNGTGGREASAFLQEVVGPADGGAGRIPVVTVNEAGASVYSASTVAREEFPEHDVTVRGAVSIGRRLMDPLSELVKIEPRSIGVGQYQHDVDPKLLDARLADTVVSCVNAVGVELNTASPHVLRYVAGISQRVAGAIAEHREANGPFASRAAVKAVSGVGGKTFEQAAGFLRIRHGEHPLDSSGVHPERYELVERMAADFGVSVADLLENRELVDRIALEYYVSEHVGLPTLRDI